MKSEHRPIADTLPINLVLNDRDVLVVGGGSIAAQKVRVLLASGARVRVVAPVIDRSIRQHASVRAIERHFESADLDGAAIVIAATSDSNLNHRIHALARRRGLLVNVVDDPAYCDFIFPSILRRGGLSIAVSTGGAGPSLARQLRESLESGVDARFGDALDALRRHRARARERTVCAGARRALAETLSLMAFRARTGSDPRTLESRMREVVEAATDPTSPREQASREALTRFDLRNAELGSRIENAESEFAGRGEIALVGAGPGHPELITLAGLRALQSADVVVYDRLVNPELLRHAADAEQIYVGKTPGEPHGDAQERINGYLVERARAGRRVVRLKGGDPFVFGRGGEELQAAREAGIPARVIPGITAALGAAAAAGIPLTHRELAGSVAFVTGCSAGDPAADAQATDWAALARAVNTLVIYMGAHRAAEIARQLRSAGRADDEPVAAIQNATLPDERIEIFSLGELADESSAMRIASPAIIIIGPVVRLGEGLTQLAAVAAEPTAR